MSNVDVAEPAWSLSDRLAKARRHAGISSRQMAEYLGVSRQTMTRWENEGPSSRPKDAYLRAWADRCNVPLEWLTGPDIDLRSNWFATGRDRLAIHRYRRRSNRAELIYLNPVQCFGLLQEPLERSA